MAKLVIGVLVILLIVFYGMKQLRRIDQKIRPKVKIIVAAILGIALIQIAIDHIEIAIITIVLLVGFLWFRSNKNKKSYKENYGTCKAKALNISESKVDEMLCQVVDQYPLSVTVKCNQKYDRTNMPYGRANAFLNLFGSSIYTETPLVFYVYNSNDAYELKEYGVLLTDQAIYISTEMKDAIRKTKRRQAQELTIPYSGLYEVNSSKDEIQLRHLLIERKTVKTSRLKQANTYLNLDSLEQFLRAIIKSNIPFSYCFETVVQDPDEALEKAEHDFSKMQRMETISCVSETVGVTANLNPMSEQFNELGNLMNASKGGGYAAEYGNATIDKLLGEKVINEAQNLDKKTGKQKKDGADRSVNGFEIQTKYYKSARETINSTFEKGEFKYYSKDGTPMQIEVPRDQYHDALQVMQKKIDNGDIIGIEPGTDARKYVRKGWFSYNEAQNIAIGGTIESLTVDILNGCITCTSVVGISAVITFSLALWQGASIEEAAQLSINTAVRIMGKSATVYLVTMQITRKRFRNYLSFLKHTDGTKSITNPLYAQNIENPLYAVGDKVANSIKNSKLAKSSVGNALGLNKVAGKQIISGGVTAVVMFGPDVVRAVSGKISRQQLVKNSTVTAAAASGGIVGQVLIPIPFVGAAIGGSATSFVAKKLLDDYIEDDAVKMFRILKEEFLECTMSCHLSQEEFQEVVAASIGHENLSDLLKQIFQSDDYHNFVKVAIMQPAITNIMARRKNLSDVEMETGLLEFAGLDNEKGVYAIKERCPNCGVAIEKNKKFCENCGTLISIAEIKPSKLPTEDIYQQPLAAKENDNPSKLVNVQKKKIVASLIVAVLVIISIVLWQSGAFDGKEKATVTESSQMTKSDMDHFNKTEDEQAITETEPNQNNLPSDIYGAVQDHYFYDAEAFNSEDFETYAESSSVYIKSIDEEKVVVEIATIRGTFEDIYYRSNSGNTDIYRYQSDAGDKYTYEIALMQNDSDKYPGHYKLIRTLYEGGIATDASEYYTDENDY